jgi:hypothetical protein
MNDYEQILLRSTYTNNFDEQKSQKKWLNKLKSDGHTDEQILNIFSNKFHI